MGNYRSVYWKKGLSKCLQWKPYWYAISRGSLSISWHEKRIYLKMGLPLNLVYPPPSSQILRKSGSGSRMSKKTGDSMSLSSTAPPELSPAGLNILLNAYKTKHAKGKTSRGTQYFNRCPKAPFLYCNWTALSLDFSWHFLAVVWFDQSSGCFAILWLMFAAPFESLCYLSPSQITGRPLQDSVNAFLWRFNRS